MSLQKAEEQFKLGLIEEGKKTLIKHFSELSEKRQCPDCNILDGQDECDTCKGEGSYIFKHRDEEIKTLVNEYLANSKQLKLNQLEITTIPNGLIFYTDDKSLMDLISADRMAERLGATDEDFTIWKTPDGNKEVQIKDIRMAIDTRLSNKGKIVGATSEN